MAKISAILIAAVSVLAGVQAAKPCPPNHRFCGSELVDVYQCISANELVTFTPGHWQTSIYPVDSNGDVQQPITDCASRGGCANAGPNGIPDAHCNA